MRSLLPSSISPATLDILIILRREAVASLSPENKSREHAWMSKNNSCGAPAGFGKGLGATEGGFTLEWMDLTGRAGLEDRLEEKG